MSHYDTDGFSNLVAALGQNFSHEEANSLAKILYLGCSCDSMCYEEIDIEPDLKDDMILLAFEERVLLPMKSLRGSAWEDRILSFTDQERYQQPRIVKFLIEKARETGTWDLAYAIGAVLGEAGESQVKAVTDYTLKLMDRALKFEVEVGVMQAVTNESGIEIDMHDTLDRFVRCGIMSPRTQRSLHTGFSKYEINPSLYWK